MNKLLQKDNFIVLFKEFKYNDDTDSKYRTLGFHPEWFVNFNNPFMLEDLNQIFVLAEFNTLNILKPNFEDEIIFDKSVFFNQINIYNMKNSFIYVDNSMSNEIIKHKIVSANESLQDMNFYSISYKFLFDGKDNIENLLFDGNDLVYFIFSSEVNLDDIATGYNFIKEYDYEIKSLHEKQILSLIGKFYSNKIILANDNIIDYYH